MIECVWWINSHSPEGSGIEDSQEETRESWVIQHIHHKVRDDLIGWADGSAPIWITAYFLIVSKDYESD